MPNAIPAKSTSTASTAARCPATAGETPRRPRRPGRPDRQQPAPHVRDPPRRGIQHRLDAGGDEEDGADPDRAHAELVEAQRDEHAHRREQQRGQRHEPHAAEYRAVLHRRPEHRQGLRLLRHRRRRRGRPHGEHEAEDADRREGDLDPDHRRDPAEDGPEERADDRGAHGRPDQQPAPLGGRLGDEPRERGRPRQRAREALHEAREVEHDDVVGEPEDRGRDHHQQQPCDHASA